MGKFIDLTGQRFGRLVIIERVGKDKQGSYLWLCLCDCGNKITTSGVSLRAKRTRSCGCFQKETISKLAKGNKYAIRHGHEGTKTYRVWGHIIQRCHNPNNERYADYGGRGITVCERWKNSFENFLEDMGEAPVGLQIDRANNNKGYYKENCEWVTSETNCRNRRNNQLITHDNKTQCLAIWSEETGIHRGIIIWRLNNGWSTEEALTTPVKKRKVNG